MSILIIYTLGTFSTKISRPLDHAIYDVQLMNIAFGFLYALIFIVATSIIVFIKFIVEVFTNKEPKNFWNFAASAVLLIDMCAIVNFVSIFSLNVDILANKNNLH